MAVDADTLDRARRGDAAAWRAVVEAHAAAVVAIAGDGAIAEEILVAVGRDLPRYALGVDRLAVWIETRARKRAGPTPAAGPVDAPAAPSGADLATLVERVVARREPPEERPARRGIAFAFVLVAVAAVVVLTIARTRRPPGPARGAVQPATRAEIRIGASVAVVEPGAALRWDGGAIDQRAGNVFYRIDAPVTITTPHGRIATGRASLRVIVGATTEVTIDEGAAVVGGVRRSAGERAVLP